MSSRGVPRIMMDEIAITPLVPKHRDISTLSFITFKVDASNDVANIITKVNFWPPSCVIKSFTHKPVPIADLNFSAETSTHQSVNFPVMASSQNTGQRMKRTSPLIRVI